MRRTITDQWIEAAQRAISKSGMSQNEIAKKVGGTGSALSLILGGTQQSSKLIEPLSRLLNIDLPPLNVQDPQILELAEIAADLSEDNIELLKEMARSLKRSNT